MKKISKICLLLVIMLISFFSVISKGYALCELHKDMYNCENEKSATCVWIDESIIHDQYMTGCYEAKEPTASSPACSSIKDKFTCSIRTDCSLYYGDKCLEKGLTKEEANKKLDAYDDLKYGDLIYKDTEPFLCSNVKYFTKLWMFIRIISPFIVILFGSLDFFKSMVAGDEKGMKASRGKFVKRIIAFLLLIILPFVLQFIFSTIGTYGSQNVCMIKCIATNDTSAKGCE